MGVPTSKERERDNECVFNGEEVWQSSPECSSGNDHEAITRVELIYGMMTCTGHADNRRGWKVTPPPQI